MDPDQWDSLTPEQQDAVLSGPALDPPPGVDPGRHSPPNHNALVLGVTTTLLVLTTACALVRTYSKLAIDRKVNLGDILALLGYVSSLSTL
ncbi:hypothetical protein SAMD00023353_2300900 [Rosellinia necatrix]|uniref:Uncharacterized protein n=1 Tax=Rosellinia necatrix TaxID=77044 RepID=A0A1S8A7V1_ROSNE|nr:hypothetical protein SAMD00023353_2300900 [Rosellinia necatrix]